MTPEPTSAIASATPRLWQLAALSLIVLLIPPGLYWLTVGRVATVTPTVAKAMLSDEDTPTALVDVRPSADYLDRHIDGAQHWPADQISAATDLDDVPVHLAGKRLLLVCDVGLLSVDTTAHLASIGVSSVFNVRGGSQAWIGSVTAPEGGLYDRWRTGDGEIVQFPVHEASQPEQLAAVASGFGMKAVYTLMALALVIILWRQRAADLAALRWALIFFFVGENCCAVNYWVFAETSYLFEYLHSAGMVLCFSFAAYAAMEGVDARIIGVSDPAQQCAAIRLCVQCAKNTDTRCGLRRMSYLIILGTMVPALMVLTVDRTAVSYNAMIYGTFYNYAHPMVYQLFESVYCPLAAIVLSAVSIAVLALLKRTDPAPWAKLIYAAAVGPLAFGLFRTVLAGLYEHNMVWFILWEEANELLLLLALALILHTFRRGLFGCASPQERQ